MTVLDRAAIAEMMAAHGVPGLSMATVSGNTPAISTTLGLRDRQSGQAMDADTVFEAASLTKPVFAYAVLKLAQDGILSLDQPLADILPFYLEEPAGITPRHVLSHTAGLPNWRSDAAPLRGHFPPGHRFSYSGEGYVYLQKAVEKLCSESLDRIVASLVFAPLGMTKASLIWRDALHDNHAVPHTAAGQIFDDGFAGKRFTAANAAGSLYTTAEDYVRFLEATMAVPFLAEWLTPQTHVLRGSLTNLDPATEPATRPDIAWGLGWGIELQTGCVFHWGDQKGFKAFAIAAPASGNAAVVLTNGDAGLSFLSRLLEPVFPGPRPSLDWLGYEG